MAQRTIVVKTCDVHGDETEATETVSFGIGSERFEIDCCAGHGDEVRSTLARYAGLGRRTTGGRQSAASSGKPRGGGGRWSFGAADLTAEEREFALTEGWPGRGRIKNEIMEKLAEKRGVAVA